MGQRVRRLSSSSGEDRREGDGQEQREGEAGEVWRREERRRQAQQLQIHRELQNVEVGRPAVNSQLYLSNMNKCLQVMPSI